MDLSVIIPAFDEAGEIEKTLETLRVALADASFETEVLVVDGGSTDGTCDRAGKADGVRLIRSEPGRARQMNAGAKAARGERLFFLHADTHVSREALADLERAIGSNPNAAFCFRLEFRGSAEAYRTMERGVAWRCRTFALPYGDQGLVIGRDRFFDLGGFDEATMLEDLELVLRMRSRGERIEMLRTAISTSVRQWDRQGIVWGIVFNLTRMTMAIMQFYFEGAGSPEAKSRPDILRGA